MVVFEHVPGGNPQLHHQTDPRRLEVSINLDSFIDQSARWGLTQQNTPGFSIVWHCLVSLYFVSKEMPVGFYVKAG